MSELSSQHKDEITRLLNAGKKLQAIKYARQVFKISLKDAVRLVNTVDQELHPEKTIDIDSFSGTSGLPRIFYYVFGIVGGVMVIAASMMFYFDQQAINNSDAIPGEVIDFHYDEGTAAPVVRYQWRGDEYTYYSSTYSSPPSYDIGEKVVMYVNRSDPHDAVIDSFSDRYLGIVILGGLGCFFLGFLVLFSKVMGKSTI